MAHTAQYKFVRTCVEGMFSHLRVEHVLEIGSADINGSIRSLFAPFSPLSYCGVDISDGPGVDIIKSGHLLDFPTHHFDAVLSFECFEHNPFWKETFANMVRMCKPGGVVIISCASLGRMEHGTDRTTPVDSLSVALGWDYYKNISPQIFVNALNIKDNFDYVLLQLDRRSCDLYFFGLKAGESNASHFSDWFRKRDSYLSWGETDLPTVILSVIFSYMEQFGLAKTPWIRFRLVSFLKKLKRYFRNLSI